MNTKYPISAIEELNRESFYALIKPDGYCIAGNVNLFEQFRYSPGTPQELHITGFINPIHHTAFMDVLASCLQEPGKSKTIVCNNAPDFLQAGQTEWELCCMRSLSENQYVVQVTAKPIQTNNNNSLQPAAFDHSNTEMLAEMLSNSVDVFILVDEQCNIRFCSTNISHVLGYSETELLGQVGFSLVHPEDLNRCIEIFEAEINEPGKNKAVDIRFRKKDGSWLWTEAKGKNLFHNPLVGAMLINLNDITVRKSAEQMLKERKEQYKSFFNNLPLPLLVISEDHQQIVDVNRNAIERYGYTLEEFTAISVHHLFAKAITCSEIESIYKNNTVVEHCTKNGDIFLVTVSRHEVAFAGANGYLLQVTDVTEATRTKQESELGLDIADTLIQPKPLKTNLKLALGKLRQFGKWDLAELWLTSFDGIFLKNEISDFDEDLVTPAFEEYIAKTKNTEFPAKDYIDKGAMHSLKPFWIEDVAATPFPFKRMDEMTACGLVSTLIIPVVSEQKVVCCIAFFSTRKKQFNRNELAITNAMATLLGAEISKHLNSMMLDQFFNISKDILTIAGMDGRYIRVNPAFEAFSGYTAAEAKLIHPLSYAHDFDKAAVYEKLQELSNGKSVDYFENRVVTKDGKTKWIAWTATPLMNEGIVIASHRDITAQKEMLEALTISNERYEYVKRATNEAIWDFDLKRNVILRSDGYKVLFDYDTDSEHTSLDFWESKLHPDDRERVIQQLHSFLSQSAYNQWQCEYRFLKNDGTYAFVSDKGFKIHDRDGMPVRFVGAMQDITEQKMFAEKLRLSNERYMLVANATREAIWDLDFETQGITWSDGYRILFGHGFEDAETGNDFWESNIHPDDRLYVLRSFRQFLNEPNQHTPHWECEYRFRKKDGSFAYVSDKCYLIYDKEGKPIRVVGAMQDITRQKNLEREIIEKERSRQNQIAQAAVFAQEKERAEIGKELHDNIGQLLTTTKLYLEMLKTDQENPDVLIDRSTNHINSIIHEVRNLSRSLVPHSLNDLGIIASINDLVDSFRVLDTLDIELIASEEVEDIKDTTVKLTLYRILQEQLNNIVRHAEAQKVIVELTLSDNKVRLYVEDNGKGFDLRTIKKGQGIMNIKSRAELHEGSAELITNPEQGCKLFVLIPITKI